MKNKENNINNKIVTKGQLKFIILTNIFIFITIGVIIYELYNKIEHYVSYIMLGVVFILMAINQYIYYKNNKTKNYIILTVLYSIIGISIIIYRISI